MAKTSVIASVTKRCGLFPALMLAVTLLFAAPAYADCTSPDSPEGGLQYFTGDDYKYCDGSNWIDWGGGGGSASAAGINGAIQFNNSSAFAGSSVFVFDSANGRVGIGTASPGTASGARLDVQNTGVAVQAQFGDVYPFYLIANSPNLGMNAYFNSGWKRGAGAGSSYAGVIGFQQATGNMDFQISNVPTTADSAISLNTLMRIAQNGYVGIGTTTPGAMLHVNAASAGAIGTIVKGAASQTANLQEWRASNDIAYLSVSADGRSLVGTESSITLSGGAGSQLTGYVGSTAVFSVNHVTGARFNATIPIGWTSFGGGTDSSSTTALWQGSRGVIQQRNGTDPQTYAVYGTYTSGTDHEGLRFKATSTGNSEIANFVGSGGGTLRGIAIGGYSAGASTITPWMNFTSAGYVGIGDTTPDSGTGGQLMLDVAGGVGATKYCDDSGNNCFTAASVSGGAAAAAGPEGAIQYNNSSSMAGNSSFVYTSAGRVGIGTASPTVTLDVTGGLRVSGTGFISNVNFLTGIVYSSSTDLLLIGGGNSTSRAYILMPNGISDPLTLNATASGSAGVLVDLRNSGPFRVANGRMGINSTVPDAMLHVNAASAAAKGVIIRGADSQSANLTEWQDSAGTAMSFVSPSGIPTWRNDNPSGNTYYDAEKFSNIGVVKIHPVQKLTSFGGQSADHRVDIYGGSQYGNGAQFTVYGQSYSVDTARQGSAEFMVGPGSRFFLVEYNGILESLMYSTVSGSVFGRGSYFSPPTPAGQLEVTSRSASRIAFVSRAANAQSANIQEWQNNAGTALAFVAPSGQMNAPQYCDETGANCFTAASVGGGGASAAGADRTIQFNNASAFAGDSAFTFTSSGRLTLAKTGWNTLVDGGSDIVPVNSLANIAIGVDSLKQLPRACPPPLGVYCSSNIAIGYRAMENNIASSNIAIGTQAMVNMSNSLAMSNLAIGGLAMQDTTNSTYNVALGDSALRENTTGSNNVAVGASAGFGVNATTTAANSVFVGYRAAAAITTGGNNIMVGYQAGDNVTTGANNIIIGYDINASSAGASEELNIGGILKGDIGTTSGDPKIGAAKYCDENLANCFTAAGVGGGASAAGADGAIQFNNSSAFAGASTFVYKSATGYLGLGASSPGAMLQVNAASAGSQGIVARGYTSQTGDLFRAENSSGTLLFAVSSSGNLRMGSSTAPGTKSVAFGSDNLASGAYSAAFGQYSRATGSYSMAMGTGFNGSGNSPLASGTASFAGGVVNDNGSIRATGDGSFAFGISSGMSGGILSSGSGSFAHGYVDSGGDILIASGLGSTAWGFADSSHPITASGMGSTAWGGGTTASGTYSTAFGYETKALGARSIAISTGDASTTTFPQVSGAGSIGFFMGNQASVDLADTNIMSIMGGRVGIGTVSPASAGSQILELDVEGDVGATNYCDSSGNNCFNAASAVAAISGGGGGGVAAGPNQAVQYNSSSAFAGSSSFVFNATSGYVGIGTASPTAPLVVSGAPTGSYAPASYEIGVQKIYTNTSGVVASIAAQAHANPMASSSTANVYAIYAEGSAVSYAQSTTANPNGLVAVGASIVHRGDQTVAGASGLYVATPVSIMSGPVTNMYGLYLSSQKIAAVSNAYGVYQAGTNDRNIFMGNVNVGSSGAPGAQMRVVAGAAGTKASVVQAAASQTANLTEWQNDSGTALAFVSSSGQVHAPRYCDVSGGTCFNAASVGSGGSTVAAGANNAIQYNSSSAFAGASTFVYNPTSGFVGIGTATPAAALVVGIALPGGAGAPTSAQIGTIGTFTNTSGAEAAISAQAWANPGGTSTAMTYGVFGEATTTSGQTFSTTPNLIGVGGRVWHRGFNSAAGAALYAGVPNNTGGGGLTAYGLYIASQSAFGVYQAGTSDRNVFMGNVNVGSSGAPGAQMRVVAGAAATKATVIQAAASQTANLTEWQSSNGTALSFVSSSGQIHAPRYCDVSGGVCFNAASVGSGGGGTPAGSDRQIQFNDANAFGAATNFVYTSSGYVGIGVNAPSGSMLQVNTASAGAQGVYIKGYASQTGDLLRIEDSSGVLRFVVSSTASMRTHGSTASGYRAHALGISSGSFGTASMSWGNTAIASGGFSTAWGTGSATASGTTSTAWGNGTLASGGSATAFGLNTTASGNYTTTWGANVTASGGSSTVVGLQTQGHGTRPIFSGTRTFGIIMDQGITNKTSNFNFTGSDTFAVIGGRAIIDPTVTATTTGASLQVNATSSGIGLLVKGEASQTGRLTEWQNSSATALAFVSSSGQIHAPRYCDVSGGNCFNAASATGAIEIVTGQPAPTAMNLDDLGDVDAASPTINDVLTWDGSDWVAAVGGAAAGSNYSIQYNNSSAFGGTSTFVYNAAQGYVGIGTASPSVALDVAGDIEYTGTITDVSDMRLKTDIVPLDKSDVIERLNKVKTYSFRMKKDASRQLELGVMAQELEIVFPELVRTADDEMGTKSVNYVGLIAPLIEASKDLKAENDAMKSDLEQMKDDIAQLKIDNMREAGFGITGLLALSLLMSVLGSSIFFVLRRKGNE